MEYNVLTTAQEAVLTLFNHIHPVSSGLSNAIREHTKIECFKKKDHLLRLNETNRRICFIVKGAVRTYYIDKDGHDITSWLLFEGDLAISVYSFFSQCPSFEAIEAIEDCCMLSLSYEKLSRLYLEFLELNYIGRRLTEQYYIRSEEKANALRILNARERYLDLLQKYPLVLTRVPLGYIASYLGITQSTLSRVRAGI